LGRIGREILGEWAWFCAIVAITRLRKSRRAAGDIVRIVVIKVRQTMVMAVKDDTLVRHYDFDERLQISLIRRYAHIRMVKLKKFPCRVAVLESGVKEVDLNLLIRVAGRRIVVLIHRRILLVRAQEAVAVHHDEGSSPVRPLEIVGIILVSVRAAEVPTLVVHRGNSRLKLNTTCAANNIMVSDALVP